MSESHSDAFALAARFARVAALPPAAFEEARAASGSPANQERLRRDHALDATSAAWLIEVALARHAARPKFGERADQLFADRTAIQQASSLVLARHKAERFAEHGVEDPVLDLACGIGADALGLQERGLRVLGVDLDPLRARCFAANTGAPSVRADATTLPLQGRFVHCDPARRTASGKRLHGLPDLQPGLDFLVRLMREARGCVLKLGPGDEASEWPFAADPEWVSEDGRLVQLLAWGGEFRRGERTATLLKRAADPGGVAQVERIRAPLESPSEAVDPAPHPMQELLWVPDPALERSELALLAAQRAGAHLVHPGHRLFTAPHAPAADALGFTAFELLEAVPPNPKGLRKLLRKHGFTRAEIKVRGRAIEDANALERRLNDGPGPCATLFLVREGSKRVAWLTRRLGQ